MPVPGEVCLMCGQVIPPKNGRVCGKCGLPILKHHKFFFAGSEVRHRNCSDPKEYSSTEGKQ